MLIVYHSSGVGTFELSLANFLRKF